MSDWSQGYVVDLVDAMAKHVDQARAASQRAEHPLRDAQQGDAAGWIASVVGAIVLLFVYGLLKGKASSGPTA